MTTRRILAALAAGVVMVLPTASAGLSVVTMPVAAVPAHPDGKTFCIIFPWFFTCRR